MLATIIGLIFGFATGAILAGPNLDGATRALDGQP